MSDEGTFYHWQAAQEAIANQDVEQAKIHVRHCLEAWPLDAQAHFLLARLCRRTDDLAGWQVHFKNADALQWPAEELAREGLFMRLQLGDMPGSERIILKQLDSPFPEKAFLLEAMVKGCLIDERIAAAISWTEIWMERFPNDWQAYWLRGQAHQSARAMSKAIGDFQRALDLRPGQPEALLSLASALVIEGHHDTALDYFLSYLRLRPGHPGALFGVANCHYCLGQREKAYDSLQVLFGKQPEHAAGSFLGAKIALDGGDNQEALRWLRKAEKLAPNETDITYTLALVLKKLDQLEEAGIYDRKLEDLRTWQHGLEKVRKEIRAQPDKVHLRHQAGTLCLKLGREEEAARWFLSALHLDPNDKPTHQALADYYKKQGDQQRAELHRHKAEANAKHQPP